jgi:hypothetical protein
VQAPLGPSHIAGPHQLHTRTLSAIGSLTLPPLPDGSELERNHFCRGLLTSFGVLAWRQMSKRAMGPMMIVIVAPRADDLLGVRDRFEAVHVQALVTQTAVKALDKCVPYRLSSARSLGKWARTGSDRLRCAIGVSL